jgi:membrane protein
VITRATSAARSAFATAREKAPFLDHVIRMWGRYAGDGGDRLAAAVTFYWFLSLFPILLLAIAILGYVYGDSAPAKVTSGLSGYLPDQLVKTLGDTLVSAKGKAGVIGLVGLLLSGLGWVDGLRQAIRTIWHQNVQAGNFLVTKLVDSAVLLGLFVTIGVSVIATGATTAATGHVIDLLGLSDTTAARVFTQVLAYLLSGAADTLLFVYLFTGLPKVRQPVRKVVKSAVFGAVGFEVLKFAGAYYVARTTSKGEATYGAFAVVVGLLLFLNLVSRWILLTAAFAVTRPYDSDALPSGTATPEQARRAGIPAAYADPDPDDPPLLEEAGAPTPLRAAIQGRPAPQREPAVPESAEPAEVPRSWAAATVGGPVDPYPVSEGDAPDHGEEQSTFRPVPAPEAAPPAAGLRGAAAARAAGNAGAALIGLSLAGVAVYAAGTVRAVLRR